MPDREWHCKQLISSQFCALGALDARIGARDGGVQAQEEADPGLLREGAEDDVHHDELRGNE